MKRSDIVLSVFIGVHLWPFLLCLCSTAAELSLPTQSTAPGSHRSLPVTFASQSSSVTALQFDLRYDGAALTLSATAGAAALTAAKTLHVRDLAPGRKRFVIAGLNQTSLGDGILINLFANLKSKAPPQTYALKLLNIVAADASAQTVTVHPVDGAVTFQEPAGSALRPQSAVVLNAASLLPGPVAPGELVTLLGAGLEGATILFDGTPAPLLYTASNQVNAIVPYAIYGRTSTTLQLARQGQSVAELVVPVVAMSPAIFTVDGSGVGQGAILNQDSSLNSPSTPAAKGSTIVLFATGAGQTDPVGVDGQLAAAPLPKPLLPVSVQIGGLPAQVLYAGAAPTLVAGVLQVNCIVPAASPSGYAIPIILTVATAPSQPGVTVAIQ